MSLSQTLTAQLEELADRHRDQYQEILTGGYLCKLTHKFIEAAPALTELLREKGASCEFNFAKAELYTMSGEKAKSAVVIEMADHSLYTFHVNDWARVQEFLSDIVDDPDEVATQWIEIINAI